MFSEDCLNEKCHDYARRGCGLLGRVPAAERGMSLSRHIAEMISDLRMREDDQTAVLDRWLEHPGWHSGGGPLPCREEIYDRSLFLDTNVLIYSQDLDEPEKYRAARRWFDQLRRTNTLVLSAQSVLEYYAVARRRFVHVSRPQLRSFARSLLPLCRAPAGLAVAETAWKLEDQTGYGWYDCLLLASATESKCRYFVSEHLQHGRKIDDLTIISPSRVTPTEVLSHS